MRQDAGRARLAEQALAHALLLVGLRHGAEVDGLDGHRRPMLGSMAWYTTPMAPRPSSRTILYRPMRSIQFRNSTQGDGARAMIGWCTGRSDSGSPPGRSPIPPRPAGTAPHKSPPCCANAPPRSRLGTRAQPGAGTCRGRPVKERTGMVHGETTPTPSRWDRSSAARRGGPVGGTHSGISACLQNLAPAVLRFEQQFHHFADRALAARNLRHIVRRLLRLRPAHWPSRWPAPRAS